MDRDFGLMRALTDAVPEWLDPVFIVVSLLGELMTIIVLMSIILGYDMLRTVRSDDRYHGISSLCSDRVLTMAGLLLGAGSTIVLLETFFALGRPPEQYHAVAVSPFSFPSGHTMVAIVFWGAMAYWGPLRRVPYRYLLVGVIVAAVATARLALGVHYLGDILGSIFFGLVYFGCFVAIVRNEPLRGFAIALILASLTMLIAPENPRSPIAFTGTVVAIGGLFTLEYPPLNRRVSAIALRLSRSS